MNTRQQTERDLKKVKRKLGTIEEMCQVSLSPCGYLNNYIIMLLLENCFDLISVKVKIGFGFVFPTFLATKQNCTFNFI